MVRLTRKCISPDCGITFYWASDFCSNTCRMRESYRANRAYECYKKRIYYILNTEKMKKRAHEYRENNRDHFNWACNEWHKRNVEKDRRKEAEYRAAKYGRVCASPLTDIEWNALVKVYRGRCAYCKKKMTKPTMDHVIPISRGGHHSMDNVVPACMSCNASKGNKDVDEFLWQRAHV